MKIKAALFAFLALPALLGAAVIGTNPPSLPLSLDRIATLPATQQPAWREYVARSTTLRAADQKFLADEIKAAGIKEPVPFKQPPPRTPSVSAGRPAEWFASAEGREAADNVVSFQTPAGGWSKNFNTSAFRRQPGQAFAPETNISRFLTPGDYDTPHDKQWAYIGTFDNNATIGEIRFLAKVVAAHSTSSGQAADEKAGAAWRAACLRGINYVLTAQYPNGGWPQIFPVDGGYHDSITFNDGAITNIVEFVGDVGAGKNEFAWVPADLRQRAAASEARGIACILACQLVVDGRRTAWCQQNDMLTLAPTSARNFEMPSQSGGESAGLAVFLMAIKNPSPEIVSAVHAAAHWFEKTAVRDVAFARPPGGGDRKLIPSPGAGPIWSRYYELKTDRPIFGDRDKSIHDDVNEISAERRNGYSWYNNGPQRALDQYAKWAKLHPEK